MALTLLDLWLFQFGWEQCAPLHSFGPFARNRCLLHYIISGRGCLNSGEGRPSPPGIMVWSQVKASASVPDR